MLVPILLRDVRRRAGLSVRAAAARCGVPRATWSAWEAGTTSPTARRLDEVLAVLDLDLSLAPRQAEPPGADHVARFLRRSLTSRARAALGDQLECVLAACRTAPRLLTGPAAVGVWVPHVRARGPLPLPPAPDDPALVRVQLALVGGAAWSAVPTPAALVSAGRANSWPALRTSARLLAVDAPRDEADRRLPAHRDPDETREIRDLAHTLTWGARSFFPVSEQDSRSWRLDAPASLDEQLRWKGFPPRHVHPDRWRAED